MTSTPNDVTPQRRRALRWLPAGAIARLRWRSDTSSLPLHTIVRKLGAQGEPRQAGVDLPADARTVAVRARRRGVSG